MSSFQSKFVMMILAEVEAAILKASNADVPEFETREAARDSFRDMVLADLAERLGGSARELTDTVVVPEAEHAPKTAPVEEEKKKERKARSPMTAEQKAAMKAKRDATIAAKKAGEASPEDAAPADAAPAPESPKEKKKRAPKAKVATDANLAKVDPTWRKHLKTAAKAQGREVTKEMEAELLTHLNGLDKEEFNAKKAEEHVAEFVGAVGRSNAAAAPAAPAAPVVEEQEKVQASLEIVEFEGKDYYVNPETKRVYEGEGQEDPDGGWTNYKPVGYVGMAAFATMELE